MLRMGGCPLFGKVKAGCVLGDALIGNLCDISSILASFL